MLPDPAARIGGTTRGSRSSGEQVEPQHPVPEIRAGGVDRRHVEGADCRRQPVDAAKAWIASATTGSTRRARRDQRPRRRGESRSREASQTLSQSARVAVDGDQPRAGGGERGERAAPTFPVAPVTITTWSTASS